MQAVRFAMGDALVEGILVPFGPPADSYNTVFFPPGGGESDSETTDYCFDAFPPSMPRPLLWSHGLDDEAGAVPVGRVSKIAPRADGLWMTAILDKSSRFYARIKGLIQRGKLFFSSGSLQHLASIAPSGAVKRWPVVEASLTEYPASPRAVIAHADLRSHYARAGLRFDERALRQREVAALERYCLDQQVADLRRWARGWGLVR